MSTARFNTLQNAAGSKSVPVDTVVDGSAKAWVNFNGTGTVAIRAAFNVSSITDLGTGDYQMNFTTAMPDANYAAVMALDGMTLIPLVRNYATTSVRLTAAAGNNVQVDMTTVSASIFR